MIGENATRAASRWVYEGVWAVLTDVLRVPRNPPSLPLEPGEQAFRLQLGEGWLKWRKLIFWILCLVIDVALIAVWVLLLSNWKTRPFALFTAPLWLVVIVLPDIIAYVAIHLQYDTTWYIMTGRSMRLRRGVWSVVEVTITYENIQNVRIQQGPVQRLFGFSTLVVETAGGGGHAGPHGAHASGHQGLIDGVADAAALKEMIMARARASRGTGLGDELVHSAAATPGGGWSSQHVEVLRCIASEARAQREALGA
jgi:membrane protein YdbS with pleckstrin-like domain